MKTRGLVGFREIEGRTDNITEIGIYNIDSYPSRLGYDVISWLQTTDLNKLKTFLINNVNITQNHSNITDIISFINAIKKNETISINNKIDFISDSLFCEWAYMFNLKTKELEIYKGLNKDPEEAGDYVKHNEYKEFYGCRLLFTIPFKTIKQISQDKIKDMCIILEVMGNFLSLKKYNINTKQAKVILNKTKDLYQQLVTSDFNEEQLQQIYNTLWDIVVNKNFYNNKKQKIIFNSNIINDILNIDINIQVTSKYNFKLYEKYFDYEIFVNIMNIYAQNNEKDIKQIESIILSKHKIKNVFKNLHTQEEKNNITIKNFKI